MRAIFKLGLSTKVACIVPLFHILGENQGSTMTTPPGRRCFVIDRMVLLSFGIVFTNPIALNRQTITSYCRPRLKLVMSAL